MTGKDLWSTFIGSGAPNEELIALGEDVGHLVQLAGRSAQQALLKICMRAASTIGEGKIVFSPSQLYAALQLAAPESKLMRKGLLHAIADQYRAKASYEQLWSDPRAFIDDVVKHLPCQCAQTAPSKSQASTVAIGGAEK